MYTVSYVRITARLAQSVEHQTFNLRVAGSSPLSGVCLFPSLNYSEFNLFIYANDIIIIIIIIIPGVPKNVSTL